MDLNKFTIKEASEKMNKGEVTSVEVTKACLARIEKVDKKVKACLTVCSDLAMATAEEADARRRAGEKNVLLGVPYLVKDLIMTAGIKTTAASKILENYIAPYDASIVTKLKEAGAVILGKVNLDEFAHGASTENSAFGPTHNPWDLNRVPGGSSGGSAAAVASDMCLFALGTDTGGSIRYPASFCGVTGLKPTYGRSSRFGLIAMTSSTDVPGPITKTAEDAAIVLQTIAGRDKKDASTVDGLTSNFYDKAKNDLGKITIGLPKEYFGKGSETYVIKAIDEAKKFLTKQGVKFVEVDLPHTKYTLPVYYIITPSEISSNLAKFDGVRYGLSDETAENIKETYFLSRGQGFGAETKRRIMLGTYALSAGYFDAYYLQAQKVRTIISNEMNEVLKNIDCLLTPTAPHVAFKIGEKDKDPLKMYLEDVFMVGASLAGLPAISLPIGFHDNLPIGMQLIGKKFDEETILKISYHWQQLTNYHLQKPNL
jgi:aspartyl-tRNA(Asn)/glutamyl-tRNA(Gln) amidotransferase subunit A